VRSDGSNNRVLIRYDTGGNTDRVSEQFVNGISARYSLFSAMNDSGGKYTGNVSMPMHH